MEVEKQGSREGFLQLFDWNRKSRKKLFLNDSHLFEVSRQRNERVENLEALQPSLGDVDENGESSSIKGINDCNYASSVSGDEGYGTRAPGVVARLMGLDSLPVSGICEPCSSSTLDSCSLKDAHYKGFLREHHSMSHNNNPNKIEIICTDPIESRQQKAQKQPIERFQTELLPPKSAKSIPVTHHKLLSPIKSPGFIPTKNATYVMEAAAKIIGPNPHVTPKRKVSSVGSSSVPLRIRDLKEKMEAAQKLSNHQRLKQSSDVRHMNGQNYGKRFNGSEDTPSFNNSKDLVKCDSDSIRRKGKLVPLSEHAKVNTQKKEGKKEHAEVKTNQSTKSLPSMQRSKQKRISINRASNVLKQNNQKQNCGFSRDAFTSETVVSNEKSRKAPSVNGSFGPSKTVKRVVINSKAGSKKIGSVANDIGEQSSSSRMKNVSRNKQSEDGNIHFKASMLESILANKDVKSIKCNEAVEGGKNWGPNSSKKVMDVVSFTFTSPMKKPIPGSMFAEQALEAKYQFNIDSNDENDPQVSQNSALSSLGLNVTDSDSLSVLLDEKLRELTIRVGSSHSDLFILGTSASSTFRSLESDLMVSLVVPTSAEDTSSRSLPDVHEDKTDGSHYFDCSSVSDLHANQKWQVSERTEELISSNSNNNEVDKRLDDQHPSPVLSLESSFSYVSCNSPDSRNSYSMNGSEHSSLVETDEVEDSRTSRSKSQLAEAEAELSDSVSSISILHMNTKDIASTGHLTDSKESVNWELVYMSEILCKAALTLEGFASGHAHKFMTPNLFDQMENQQPRSEATVQESSKLGRKALFDYMVEFMDLRSGQLFGGSCQLAKWATLIERKALLAEELYGEILSWRSMGEFMVDELVDKDMSTHYGKWIDFDLEAFEEGVEIENIILTTLVDELVDDLCSYSRNPFLRLYYFTSSPM